MIRKQTKVWVTKDKRKIRICDMEDSHLINTVKMLVRVAEIKLQSTVDLYLMSGGPSGEMAQICFDNELQIMMEDPDAIEQFLPDIYYNMIEDLARRGLEYQW